MNLEQEPNLYQSQDNNKEEKKMEKLDSIFSQYESEIANLEPGDPARDDLKSAMMRVYEKTIIIRVDYGKIEKNIAQRADRWKDNKSLEPDALWFEDRTQGIQFGILYKKLAANELNDSQIEFAFHVLIDLTSKAPMALAYDGRYKTLKNLAKMPQYKKYRDLIAEITPPKEQGDSLNLEEVKDPFNFMHRAGLALKLLSEGRATPAEVESLADHLSDWYYNSIDNPEEYIPHVPKNNQLGYYQDRAKELKKLYLALDKTDKADAVINVRKK